MRLVLVLNMLSSLNKDKGDNLRHSIDIVNI